jgi:polyhydroxybutyrate depolymerase
MAGGKLLLGIGGMLMLNSAVSAHGAADALVHMHFGNRDRTYRIHVPARLSAPTPLVVALHGGGGTAIATVKMTGFDAEADREGFIVVYPNGTDQSRPLMNLMGKPGFLTWNAGNCCGYALEHHIDDVGFIRAVVKQVMSQYAIDPKRIYATGISNGGMMAYTLACESSNLFAAVGIVSGIIADPSCKPAHPVSIVHFHGSADQNIPINGGIGSKAFIKDKRPPVQDSIDFWVKTDGCDAKPQESHDPGLDIKAYGGCRTGTAVTYYVIQGGGHSWPGGDRLSMLLDAPSQAVNATEVMWRFFAAHPKP